ncbi:MAG: MerR family DNA-binding transcriptional regulator [Pseudomonadota bacterium]
MAQTYSITDLAQEFGVTTRTIRHYEEQGLLTPQREGMSRVFSTRDRGRLKLALRGKRLGFSLSEIRELFELSSLACEDPKQAGVFLARLEKRRVLLEQQREDIDAMLGEISFFANQCRRLLIDTGKAKNTANAI